MRTALAILLALLAASNAVGQESPLVAAARKSWPASPSFPPMPELHTVRWFNAHQTSLAARRGQVVLLDFWATWCASCAAAEPNIERLAQPFQPAGLAVILVHSRFTRSVGSASNAADVPAENVLPKFMLDHHVTLPVAVTDAGEFERLGVRGLPHYALIDRLGRIRYTQPGAIPSTTLIQQLLAEPVPPN